MMNITRIDITPLDRAGQHSQYQHVPDARRYVAQHFLLSAKARTLSLRAIQRMSDDEAWTAFASLRWADTNGEPVCPRCGGLEAYPFEVRGRRLFKCRHCIHQFSVTSGTLFASRKLPIRTYLEAIALFVTNAKGESAVQMTQRLEVSYKTAWVLSHKLREAMGAELEGAIAAGTVEVDAAYIGGHTRKANKASDRVDRRASNDRRQTVMVVRERNGRVLPFVAVSEAAAVDRVVSMIAPGSIVHTDESSAYHSLPAYFETRRINHKEAYSLDGACTNWAESFFTRMRRAAHGQYHQIAGVYLSSYLAELGWRENHRRDDTASRFEQVTGAALKSPVSRQWAGYWQRHHLRA